MGDFSGVGSDNLDDCRFHVLIDTTSQCNLRCRHCWHEAVRRQGYALERQVMPFDLFTRICAQFRGRARSTALSCGFEPLINPEFPRYVAHAREQGFPDIHFFTNGLLLTAEMAGRIVAAGAERIIFSLEGTDPASYGEVRGDPALFGHLEQALGGLRDACRRAGSAAPRVEFNWVLMAGNVARLRDLPAWAAQWDCRRVTLMPHVRWAGVEDSAPSLAEVDPALLSDALGAFRRDCAARGIAVGDEPLRELLERRVGWRERLTLWARWLRRRPPARGVFCPQPWELILINPSGRITPCYGDLLDRVTGDLSEQPLEAIWNSEPWRDLRARLRGAAAPHPCCRVCWFYGDNPVRRRASFFEPRPMDVERLRRIIPAIQPRRGGGRPGSG